MIDWDRVSELISEVGEDEFAEVVDMFFEEVGEALEGLSGKNGIDLGEGLHFVKGSALNIGLITVSELCQTAENSIRGRAEAPVDISEICRAFDNSIAKFKAVVMD